MMPYALTTQAFLKRAVTFFPSKEIVSRRASGDLFRYTYRDFGRRCARLANALAALGVAPGDRVGTVAWNSHRHLEAYLAVPCMGAVLHTINFRLFPEQLAYIINHARDRVLLIDQDLLPAIEGIREQLTTVRHFVVMADHASLPESPLTPLHSYEAALAAASAEYGWPDDLDEWSAAATCYTSATTGNPKGVLYSHRGLYLHTLAEGLADSLAISERDVLLPVVPMFHANAWGLPFTATFFGAKQVLPGPRPDPATLLRLLQDERVTLTAGVPTVWMGCEPLLDQGGYDLSTVRAILCGGSAIPRAMIEKWQKRFGLAFLHAYGMTEATPLVTACRLTSAFDGVPDEEHFGRRATQGLVVPGVEVRLVNDLGEDLPWDGKTVGQLLIRGPWIAKEYHEDPRTAESFRDGWFWSGDVVQIDPHGYVTVVDRAKDLVKSGGEWISTVDLENALMAHEAVAEAAVFGVAHPTWQERPLACVVLKPAYQGKVTAQDLRAFLEPRFARWWLPDEILFIDEIPKSAVGKFLKRDLRDRYADFLTRR